MPKQHREKMLVTSQNLKRKIDETAGTRSIEFYFHSKEHIKRLKALKAILNQQTQAPEAAIAIPYRNDSEGRGALYDHRGIQAAAKKPTGILNKGIYHSNLKSQIERFQYQMKFGEQLDSTFHKYPPLLSEIETNYGLLLLPGVSMKDFESPHYEERKKYEMNLIKNARMVGQPILSICGGCWVLYQQYGGQITEVTDHAYRAGMPRLSDVTGKIGNNKQIHRIAIKEGENLLRAAFGLRKNDDNCLPVNSVHSYAPDPSNIPSGLEITAISVQDDELSPVSAKANNLEKEKMKPQSNTIEAFESTHGAPVLGVQWHPEAYTGKNEGEVFAENQMNLIRFMALAGQAFLNKQKLLAEFKKDFFSIKSSLRHTHLFAFNHTVVRQQQKGYFQFNHFRLKQTTELRHPDEVKWEIECKENYFLLK